MDRNNSDWKNYFLKDIEQTKYVISLQKANGEAAHMSCRFINNEFLICAGSKNVHIVFKKYDDLFEYKEPRFQFAKIILFCSLEVTLVGLPVLPGFRRDLCFSMSASSVVL